MQSDDECGCWFLSRQVQADPRRIKGEPPQTTQRAPSMRIPSTRNRRSLPLCHKSVPTCDMAVETKVPLMAGNTYPQSAHRSSPIFR
jgi:hypothetical protein